MAAANRSLHSIHLAHKKQQQRTCPLPLREPVPTHTQPALGSSGEWRPALTTAAKVERARTGWLAVAASCTRTEEACKPEAEREGSASTEADGEDGEDGGRAGGQ